jgi:hypothetical protein
MTVPGRILEALFVSVIFDAVYLGAVGGFYGLVSKHNFAFVTSHLAALSIASLLLFVALPAAIAFVVYAVRPVDLVTPRGRVRSLRIRHTYVNVPTAWDFVAKNFVASQFVRIRLEDGHWVGGWFSTRSFVSTYPEPRDIYVESEWEMDADGAFIRPLETTTGVWLLIGDSRIVEWVSAEQAKGRQENDVEQ